MMDGSVTRSGFAVVAAADAVLCGLVDCDGCDDAVRTWVACDSPADFAAACDGAAAAAAAVVPAAAAVVTAAVAVVITVAAVAVITAAAVVAAAAVAAAAAEDDGGVVFLSPLFVAVFPPLLALFCCVATLN